MLECCAFDGGFVLGAGRVAGRGYLLDGREPLIFLPNNILARSSLPIPDRTAACEEGARILGGKNMKTLDVVATPSHRIVKFGYRCNGYGYAPSLLGCFDLQKPRSCATVLQYQSLLDFSVSGFLTRPVWVCSSSSARSGTFQRIARLKGPNRCGSGRTSRAARFLRQRSGKVFRREFYAASRYTPYRLCDRLSSEQESCTNGRSEEERIL